MMLIATILLPVRDNNMRELDNEGGEVFARIIERFGGMTVTPGVRGYRKNPEGKLYVDDLLKVEIAAKWTSDEADALREIARYAAETMRQEIIFMALPTGVEFVEP